MPEQNGTKNQGNIDEGKPRPERLPPPTFWPATLALGATLLAFGVVTSWIISVAGFGLFLLGAGGWLEDLRHDQLQ
jgi:hypothetical protein